MNCVIASFVGKNDAADGFGKKGTRSDLQFYNVKGRDKALILIHAFSFPEKIVSLIQAINLSNVFLVQVGVIDASLGELIIALKILRKKTYFLLEHKNEYLKEQLIPLINGLDYEIKIINEQKDLAVLRDELLDLNFNNEGDSITEIDHFFNVKNVGVVALGVLKQGVLNARDQAVLHPQRKEIQVKTIQVMDEDLKTVSAQSRVGLSLKNCRVDELSRGSIIAKGELSVLNHIKGRLIKNEYYKRSINQGEQLTIIHGLQQITCLVEEVNNEKISLNLLKPLTKFFTHTLVLRPEEKGLRIIGELVLE